VASASACDEGVLIATGNENSGCSVFVQDGKLVVDYNAFGDHTIVESSVEVPAGDCEQHVRSMTLLSLLSTLGSRWGRETAELSVRRVVFVGGRLARFRSMESGVSPASGVKFAGVNPWLAASRDRAPSLYVGSVNPAAFGRVAGCCYGRSERCPTRHKDGRFSAVLAAKPNRTPLSARLSTLTKEFSFRRILARDSAT
jgi:hypothetical protein